MKKKHSFLLYTLTLAEQELLWLNYLKLRNSFAQFTLVSIMFIYIYYFWMKENLSLKWKPINFSFWNWHLCTNIFLKRSLCSYYNRYWYMYLWYSFLYKVLSNLFQKTYWIFLTMPKITLTHIQNANNQWLKQDF
jgi:hypothetical protein